MVFKKNILILICSFSLLSAEMTSQDYACFIAGIILIQENTQLGVQRKIQEYNRLKKITGIDIKKAEQFIESYKNKPEQWKTVNDLIMNSLNGQNEQQDTK